MARSPALLALGCSLAFLAGCAPGPRAITRYPFKVHAATVAVDGAQKGLALDGNTVVDGVVRFTVDASHAGMVLTLSDLEYTGGSIVWDDAALARDRGAERRFLVGADAIIQATRDGDNEYMSVTGPLFRQEVPPGGTVRAYAGPQAIIPAHEQGCEAILETEFRLRVPLEWSGRTRQYTFVLRPLWFDAWTTGKLEGRLRCGPVPPGTPSAIPAVGAPGA